MNVYEKLNLARIQFQCANKKMSGKNSFAGYSYYELADILPETNRICSEIKASCVVRYERDIAYLDFVDSDKPEDKITFSSPMSEANLKGCHAVQNLGAVESYIKRYLYQACFEIVESDALDATMNPNAKTETPAQVKAVAKAFNGIVQPALKGGDSTPDEKAEIANLLSSKDQKGQAIFTKEEILNYSNSRQQFTAQEVISNIKAELQRRIAGPQVQQEIF